MATVQEIAILVHSALKQAGYSSATADSPYGYSVAANKTFAWQPSEIEVRHSPMSDDTLRHTQAYFSALKADPALSGLQIELVTQPYPLIYVRG